MRTGEQQSEEIAPPDEELGRLRTENAELRAALEARTQENATLVQMLTDVISTLDLEEVLRHIVEHLVASFGCHGAFVYLWAPDRERLVMRAASERYRHLVGNIELGRGEGLVGWSALTRKPAMLRERALEDPRFRYFPELDEEQFQAILTVPITGADGTVIAVISMHTIAPQEFTDEDVRMVASMAPILGGAIETSELYENTTRKLAVLSTLPGQVQAVRSGRSLDDALRWLAEKTTRVTASELCVLILAEPGRDRLSVRAYPDGDEGIWTVYTGVLERQPWERLAATVSPTDLGLADFPLPNDRPAHTWTHMTAPLVAAGEQLGLMACYSAAARPYTDDDAALLNIIANQVAITVRNSQLADLLAERDVPARLFRDLTQGPEDSEDVVRRRAALLGCDLARLHAPAVLDLAPDIPRSPRREAATRYLANLMRRWLAGAYPGSLVHVDTTVLGLIHLPAEDGATAALPAAFDALQPSIEREFGLRLAGGVGRPCRTLADYRRGFAEAQEALRVGRAVQPRGAVVHFDGLGAARYLSSIPVDSMHDDLLDRYQAGVERVAAYDARKGTLLLETLEGYLTSGGNIARAAERLYLHRNTLVQRLEKLRGLLELDPHDTEHWLALHIALELRRLREP